MSFLTQWMSAKKTELTVATVMAISGLVAFFIYTNLNLPQGYWAVITVAAITTPKLSSSLNKMLMRLIGTLLGAIVSCVILQLSHGSIIAVGLLFFFFVTAISYFTLIPTGFGYAGIVANLTIVLILASGIDGGSILLAARDRTFEIILGILVCVLIVPILYTVMLREQNVLSTWKKNLIETFNKFKQIQYNRERLTATLKISLAACLTFFTWLYFRYPGGYWAPISCFFIMEECILKTYRNAQLRFVSHVIAAFLAGVCSFLFGDHLILLSIPLAVSFFIFGYLLGGKHSFNTMGNTLGVAVATMLLITPGALSGVEMTFARFVNVSLGIGIGLLIAHYLSITPKDSKKS